MRSASVRLEASMPDSTCWRRNSGRESVAISVTSSTFCSEMPGMSAITPR
jgi:hypothetical protein